MSSLWNRPPLCCASLVSPHCWSLRRSRGSLLVLDTSIARLPSPRYIRTAHELVVFSLFVCAAIVIDALNVSGWSPETSLESLTYISLFPSYIRCFSLDLSAFMPVFGASLRQVLHPSPPRIRTQGPGRFGGFDRG